MAFDTNTDLRDKLISGDLCKTKVFHQNSTKTRLFVIEVRSQLCLQFNGMLNIIITGWSWKLSLTIRLSAKCEFIHSLIHSFMHSTSKHSLSIYYIPSSVLSVGDRYITKTSYSLQRVGKTTNPIQYTAIFLILEVKCRCLWKHKGRSFKSK